MEKVQITEKVTSEVGRETTRQFVNFAFYQMSPSWRRLSRAARQKGSREFQKVVETYASKLILRSFSLLGWRADVDFMLWRISESLPLLEEMTVRLMATGLGKHLETRYSFLSMTRRSIYTEKHRHEGQESSRAKIVLSDTKYLFVYPFVKSREWYLLPMEKRQAMMDRHIAVGHEFPSVKIHTTYSFGLDDQEFVLAFETDHPTDFLDLVMKLRETEASRYTVRDTPIFTCLAKPLSEIFSALSA